jgi:OmpA-OmpF porin, OOP family
MLPIACAAPAGAMQLDAPICRDAPPQHAISHGNGIIELDWQDTVCLEHADRAVRMARLAERLGLPDRPIVTQYLLDRRLLPPAFRGDVPLLRIVFPERSFFDTARSEIRPEALDALRLIAESLRREVPDVAVFVAGHTDDRGGEDYNHNLSVARANAVAAELDTIGVGGVALWRVGFGEAVPLRANNSPENMAVNRRVEFIIGARAEAVATWLARQQPDLCTERGDSGRCLRRPVARREFVAEPVTTRFGLAAPVAPSRGVSLRSTRGHAPSPDSGGRSVAAVVGAERRVGAPQRTRIALAPARAPHIRISLREANIRVEAPQPF